jgi:hypothetical protein
MGTPMMTFAQYLTKYRDTPINPATSKRWTEADIVTDSGLPADLVHEWFWLIAQTDQDVSLIYMRFANDAELNAAYQAKHPNQHPQSMAPFGWIYAPDDAPTPTGTLVGQWTEAQFRLVMASLK